VIEFPPVRDGDPIDISATSYVTYRRCPENAAARFRGEYGPDSRAGFSGQLAHRVFARHLENGPISEEEFSQACREEIGAGLNMKVGSLGLKPSQLNQVIEEVGELYERFKEMDFATFANAEVGIEVSPADGVILKGSIDATFDDGGVGIRLVDWKTGGLDDPTDQLSFYSLLWAMDRDDLPGKVEAISLKTGERHDAVPSRADVEETAGNVAGMVDVVRIGWKTGTGLDRHGGPWCRYCPLLDSCSEGKAAFKVTAG
jgi:hypothetical protein